MSKLDLVGIKSDFPILKREIREGPAEARGSAASSLQLLGQPDSHSATPAYQAGVEL